MFLLDSVVFKAGLIFLGFALAGILLEATVMFLFKLNRFGKCTIDSLMANIGSFLLGVLLFLIFNKTEFEGVSQLTLLIIFYFITVFFEGWIIKLLNTKSGFGKIIKASFAMNFITFAVIYLFLTMEISV
jgi:hypothetical protein